MPQITMTLPAISTRSVPAASVEKLAPIMGDVAISWAFLDQIIEMWLVNLGYEAVKRGIAKNIPGPLEDRIELLTKCFRRMAEITHLADEAMPLLFEARELATHRHMLTHGTLSHYIAEPEAIVFMKLRFDRKQGFHVVQQEGYTFATLEEMAYEAKRITSAMQRLKPQFDDLFDDDDE